MDLSTSPTSALGVVARGVLAGAVGTTAMDLVWYSRYRRGGGDDGSFDWEFSSSTKGFDDVGAPAQVGKRVVHAVLRKDLPDRAAAWGAAYTLLGAAAIYEPIWRYDKETLAKDLSAHLVFGLATAAAYRLLERGRS